MKLKSLVNYFTRFEIILWSASVLLIISSFLIFDRGSYLTLIASVIGATSLILNAKGNPLGQFLIIIFGVLYAVISFEYQYYGEVITYLGMTAPMALFALVTWLRNPYKGNKSEVQVNSITQREIVFLLLLTACATFAFYFILKFFNTANLFTSTISIATSFFAACLVLKRSAYFTIAYALNDVVLIVLWIMAAMTDISYLSVIICFAVFLVNDLYGFVSWKRMQKRQEKQNDRKSYQYS